MFNGYQGGIEIHQTLGIITVITLEEIHHHEGIKKNAQSNQTLNSSKLCAVCFNIRDKLAALRDSPWYTGYIPRCLN
jgi:hypothetical protein